MMYFASSFFGQCGPNCTTFLIPAGEISFCLALYSAAAELFLFAKQLAHHFLRLLLGN